MLPACQSRNQHDECGFRKVKIGYQAVQRLKTVSRIDKDLRPSAPRLQHAVVRGSRLDSTAAGGSYADNPPSVLLRIVHLLCFRLVHNIEFGMHVVLLDLIHFDRPECAEPYMKRYMGDRDSHSLDLRQQVLCEVESRRGGRCRSFMLCVNGLIAGLVLKLVSDIRRKRHLAQPVENLLENPLVGKLYQPVSFLYNIYHRTRQQPVAEGNHRADLRLFSRLHQRLPDVILPSF